MSQHAPKDQKISSCCAVLYSLVWGAPFLWDPQFCRTPGTCLNPRLYRARWHGTASPSNCGLQLSPSRHLYKDSKVISLAASASEDSAPTWVRGRARPKTVSLLSVKQNSPSFTFYVHLSLRVLFIATITLAANSDNGSNWEWSLSCILVCVKYAYAIWLVLSSYLSLFDRRVCRQRRPQESRAVAEKPHDAVVKFDT